MNTARRAILNRGGAAKANVLTHGALGQRLEAYLTATQSGHGPWWGRWGTNYIYGTWSVLTGLEAMGVGPEDERVRSAVAWLEAAKREDGGWGEHNDSYYSARPETAHYRSSNQASTSFQTAWALLAAGRTDSQRRPPVLVSWGIAGGLDPTLAAGDLFLPDEVADEHGASWQTATPGARGQLLSVRTPVTRPADKQALWQACHARAVDMESATIARVCQAHGVPLLVIQAISDPASRPLPAPVSQLVDERGWTRVGTAMRWTLRHLGEIGLLWRSGIDFMHALRALRAAATDLRSLLIGTPPDRGSPYLYPGMQ